MWNCGSYEIIELWKLQNLQEIWKKNFVEDLNKIKAIAPPWRCWGRQ